MPLASFCQEVELYIDRLQLGNLLHATPDQIGSFGGEAYGTKGTPYVFKELKKGDIYFSNKTRVINHMINYDCYNDRLIIKRGEEYYMMDARQIDYVEFQYLPDTSILLRKVFLEDKKKFTLLEILYEEESILYKHHFKTFQAADYTRAYSSENRYDEYKDEHAWYIVTGDEKIIRLRPKKKSILQIMEPAAMEIEAYLKKKKPDLKSDADLIRIVELYDKLIKSR